MVDLSNFWEGKRVFITGHTGFKGSWLSVWLHAMGANVTGYSLAPDNELNMFEKAGVAEGIQSVLGDIRDLIRLGSAAQDAAPQILIHMAAQPLVLRSFIDPIETYSTNVMGTVNVLEVARNLPSIRSLLIITTDKCYENNEWHWGYRETDSLGGFDPYSSSKACTEIISSAYRSSYFNPTKYNSHRVALATARAGNVIGGGDWSTDRLVPDLIKAFSENKIAKIRNPQAIRPWQHVLDPLYGYLLLAQKLYEEGSIYSGAWNFGPSANDCQPVRKLADLLVAKWGADATWVTDSNDSFHEANFLKLDCSKANTILGWRPVWGLEKSVENLVSWYKVFISGGDLRHKTIEQIIQYTESQHQTSYDN